MIPASEESYEHMMKYKKQSQRRRMILSWMLVFVMMVGLTPMIGGNVYAEVDVSDVEESAELMSAGNPYPQTYTDENGVYHPGNCTWQAWEEAYTRLGIKLPAWGNAHLWYDAAQRDGYTVTPWVPGNPVPSDSIAVWSSQHVAYVVSADGNGITLVDGNIYYQGQWMARLEKYWQYGERTANLIGFINLKPTHQHSYTSTVTKQPTCTETGVRTYTCSCGASYTETIAKKAHSYVNQVVDPTLTEKGYTKHTCSVCGYTYNDKYVDPIYEKNGWYYCDALPSYVKSDQYTIEYNNHYEKTQSSSPGSGWTNAGLVKEEWQNSGAPYTTNTGDLAVSDSRVLVYSIYYHYCGPNAGNVGNYEQTGNFVHYDWIAADQVTAEYLGMDEGHPYYFLYQNGNRVWCQSGLTCDGSYGTHGARCQAWYKKSQYQDRVKVSLYKYTKESGWTSSKDSAATTVSYRFKPIVKEGWKHNNSGWWYQNADGSYPKNAWKKIDGEWYHFDAKGYMQTGWLKLNDAWYYLQSNGAMATGWQKVGSDWYYFNSKGEMVKDTWVGDYYLLSSGKMAKDMWIGNKYVDASGKYDPSKAKVPEGWKKNSTGWWYQNADGSYPKNEWKKIDGKWYHFDSKGYMQTGWLKLNDTWYYLQSNGVMATGWLKIGSDWYYFNSKGAMAKETWVGDYYLLSSGKMARNTWIGKYHVDENGRWDMTAR